MVDKIHEPFWKYDENDTNGMTNGQFVENQINLEVNLANRRINNSNNTGWRLDRETGKRSYSTYRNGSKVTASGVEAFRLSMGDRQSTGAATRVGTGASKRDISLTKEVPEVHGMHDNPNDSSRLPSSKFSLPTYNAFHAAGFGGGENTRKMFNANNLLELPPLAPFIVEPKYPEESRLPDKQPGKFYWGFDVPDDI